MIVTCSMITITLNNSTAKTINCSNVISLPPVLTCLWQGGLDVKYLSDRYQKGLDRTTEMLNLFQRFVAVDDLTQAGNDVVAQLHNSGSQSVLGCY